MPRPVVVVAGIVALFVGACGAPAAAPAAGGASTVRRIALSLGSPPLHATLTLPAAARPVPAVVLVGGSGPNDQDETIGPNKPFRDLADGLASGGVATLRYDKRTKDYPLGIDLATFTPTEEYVPDALAAIEVLRGRADIDRGRVFVLGHSQGGTFAPKIAMGAPSLAGVVLLAGATEPFGAALLRQETYLAGLPDPVGAQARDQLPAVRDAVRQIDDPNLGPTTPLHSPLLGGAGATYFLDLRGYDPVATARSLPWRLPLLVLQGKRDYQVTEAADLAVWIRGLGPRPGVAVRLYPAANHLFIDGVGPPSPLEYATPGTVDPQVVADIAHFVRAPAPAG